MGDGSSSDASSCTASPVGTGPRLPRREVWVDLPQEEYPGFRIKLWINYPQFWDGDLRGATVAGAEQAQPGEDAPLEAWKAYSEAREASMRRAMGRVVLEHNGWLDFDGETLPQPSDPAFWERIPTELAAVVIALQQQQAAALGNSIRRQRRS